ncbi:hypothetical protein D3C81_1507790 [compost metagenome]
MQLVEVDVVGVQTLEAALHRSDQVGAVVVRTATADVVDAVARRRRLAGDDPLVAPAVTLQVVADDGFGGTTGLGLRRHRVHLGGVDEVDAGRLGAADLLEAFGFAVLLAPGHAAERQRADLDVGSAERAVNHRELLHEGD